MLLILQVNEAESLSLILSLTVLPKHQKLYHPGTLTLVIL